MKIDLAKSATTISCSSKQVSLKPVQIEHANLCCQVFDVPICNVDLDSIDICCQSVKPVIRSGIFGKATILHITGDESTLLFISNVPELKCYHALNLPSDYVIYLDGKEPTVNKLISSAIKEDFYFDSRLSFTLEKQISTASTAVMDGTATAMIARYRTLGEMDDLALSDFDSMLLGTVDLITG